jgi:phospholipid transport system substrate-binding protein
MQPNNRRSYRMTSTKSKTNSRRRVRRGALALFAAALLATPCLADDPSEAERIVRETVDQVLEVLARKDLSTETRVEQIEEIAYQRFDFATISRLVLARSWKEFTPEQREEFLAQFKLMLSRSYGTRINRYEQEEVAILGHRVEPRGDVTVKTRIEGGTADGIEVDYRLRKKEGPWLVIDVIIEGVSLVSSYRSQFKEILGHGGPGDLLEELREKNAASP